MAGEAFADLRLNITADNYNPQVGQEVTWTITVVNDGTLQADNVNVADLLPDDTSFVDAMTQAGQINASDGVWSLGSLAAGAEATATITTVVTHDGGSVITNRASVSTDTHDCNPSNDQDHTAVNPWQPIHADLSVVKTVDNATPSIGDTVEWTITVSNNGPDTAWGTIVNDELPEGVTFLGARSTDGNYDFDSGQWNLGGLENGASAEMVVTTRVDTDAAATYVNTAVVSSYSIDNDESNNSAEAEIVVSEENSSGDDDMGRDGGMGHSGMSHGAHHGGMSSGDCYSAAFCCACDQQSATGADLQIVKLVDSPTPNLGSEVTWSVLVVNNGPEDAVNVIVNDNLPAGVEYVSDSATMGDFNPDGGLWSIGDLANGESALLQITTIATDASLAQTNIALVSSDTEDSNPANDVATATIDAIAADLELVKSVLPETATVGDIVTWTVEVINRGPDDATGVAVQDLLPAGLADAVYSGEVTDGVWQVGDLPSGSSQVLTIEATVIESGELINVAEVVASDQFDPDSEVANDDGDQSEDDEDNAVITVIQPGPEAIDDADTVVVTPELLNVVIMVDHSGSMGSDNFEDQNPSPFTGDVVGLDGVTTSRLEVVRDAIEQFADREEIGSIKILGFDGSADATSEDLPVPFDDSYVSIPHSNVSEWFDVSGGSAGTGLRPFLDDLRASGFTNYAEALNLSREELQADIDSGVAPDGQTNYYFFTDGVPLADEGDPRPNAAEQTLWEDFVVDNFAEAYGIAFGGGATPGNLLDVDLVSHQNDAGEERFVSLPDSNFAESREEENTLATSDVADIPSVLFKTIAGSTEGNILEDDLNSDGVLNSGISVTQIIVGDEIFLAADGPVDVETPEGGILEFNFTDGSYVYFAPFVDDAAGISETFTYTIEDSNGTDDGDLVINVVPSDGTNTVVEPESLLVTDNDDLFSEASVQLAANEDRDISDWAGDDGLYAPELYDAGLLLM